MDSAAPQLLRPTEFHRVATQMLHKLGIPEDDAAILADAWVWTGRRSKVTHSINRILPIAEAVREGRIAVRNDWTPVHEAGAATLLDARGTYGVIAGSRAMRISIRKAREYGVGVTVARNCGESTGALGIYPGIAVDQGMIGMANTNTTPMVPAWGGSQRIIGNQAFSIGAPAGKHPPLILDTPITAGSLAHVHAAAAAGEQLPPGIAADEKGEPTTDPEAAIKGMMLPMGGYRGYGLAVMWEVFTSALAGVSTLAGKFDEGPFRCSLFLMAIDPQWFTPDDGFTARIDELIDILHASAVAPGFDRVRVPGEPEADHLEKNGELIPVPARFVEHLRPLAESLGVDWPADAPAS